MPYTQYTLTQVLAQLAARYESSPFWTAGEATRAVNLALRTWNSLTGYWRTTVDIPAVPASDDHLVPLPGTLLYRTRITLATRPLHPVSRFGLNRIRPNWVYEYTDSGGDVPDTIQWWAPAGLYTIRIWPGNRTLQTLTVDGIAATPQLSAPGDFLDLTEADLGAILDEALHLLAFKQGGLRFLQTLALHQALLKGAAGRNAILQASAQYRVYAGLDRNRQVRPAQIPEAGAAIAGVAALTRPPDGGGSYGG